MAWAQVGVEAVPAALNLSLGAVRTMPDAADGATTMFRPGPDHNENGFEPAYHEATAGDNNGAGPVTGKGQSRWRYELPR